MHFYDINDTSFNLLLVLKSKNKLRLILNIEESCFSIERDFFCINSFHYSELIFSLSFISA